MYRLSGKVTVICLVAFVAVLLTGCGDPDRRIQGKWRCDLYEEGDRWPGIETFTFDDEGSVDWRFPLYINGERVNVTLHGRYTTNRSESPHHIDFRFSELTVFDMREPIDAESWRGLYKFEGRGSNRELYLALPWDPDRPRPLPRQLDPQNGPVFIGKAIDSKSLVEISWGEIVEDIFINAFGGWGIPPLVHDDDIPDSN